MGSVRSAHSLQPEEDRCDFRHALGLLSRHRKRDNTVTPSSDYLIAIAWFIATAILVLAAWLCAKRLFPRDSMLTRLAHAIVIAWANIVAVSVILGTLGFLHPAALLIGVAGVAVVALMVPR